MVKKNPIFTIFYKRYTYFKNYFWYSFYNKSMGLAKSNILMNGGFNLFFAISHLVYTGRISDRIDSQFAYILHFCVRRYNVIYLSKTIESDLPYCLTKFSVQIMLILSSVSHYTCVRCQLHTIVLKCYSEVLQ